MNIKLSPTKNNLITLSCDIRGEDVLNHIIPKLKGSKLLITNTILKHKGLEITKPEKSLFKINSGDYDYIFIFNIYPMNDFSGDIIDFILQKYKNDKRLIFILYIYNFTDLIQWGINAVWIKIQNNVNLTVLGYENSKNDFLFEMKLNYKVLPFISKQTLIYCVTNKNCALTADFILKEFSVLIKNQNIEIKFEDESLLCYAERKIGIINEEISDNDVETQLKLYSEGKLIIIITTHRFINIKADTLIIKSTKYYTAKGYEELPLHKIVDLMRSCKENSEIYVMTTKDKSRLYKSTLLKFKTDFSLYHKEKITIEGRKYILEYIINEILMGNSVKSRILKNLKNSFTFYKNYIDSDELQALFDDVIAFLCKKRIFINENLDYQKDVISLLFKSGVRTNSFICLAELSGHSDIILQHISEIAESKLLNYTYKGDKKINIIEKIKLNKPYHIFIMMILKISIEIKIILKQNLSDVLICFSKIRSIENIFNLSDVNFYQNSAFTSYIDIKLEDNKLKATVKSKDEYYILIEKSKVVINICKTSENVTFEINYKCYEVYCICLTDFNKSCILNVQEEKLGIIEKYYNEKKLLKYVKKQKSSTRNYRKKTKVVAGVEIELYLPDKITLPSWFVE